MAEPQSASEGEGDSSCFATDDRRSWSCDSNCGAEAKKEEFDDEVSCQYGGASHLDPEAACRNRSSGGTDGGADIKERRRRRQKLANKDNLVCQVCSDKANGYNFGAVTCESCKAFFRRNALKNWDIKCNFDGTCKIDPFTRKFCTACRLQKCFSINMKKEWILDEEALKKRKKLSRRSSGQSSVVAADSCIDEGASVDSSSSGSSTRRQHEPVVTSADSSVGAMPRRVVALPNPASALLRTAMPPPSGPAFAVCALSPPGATAATVEAADACCASSSMSMGGTDKTPTCAEHVVPLTEDDSKVIADILTNHAQTADPFDRPFWDKVTIEQPTRPQDVYNMADGFIRRLIKFVKILPEFSSLSQDDQIALLKGGIMETLVIRSAYTYDPSIGGFKITSADTHEQRDLKISMMFRGLGDDVYNEHMKFITSFNTSAKWNKTIIVLAMVINLFSPDRAGLCPATKPTVAAAEERYSQLLLRYLQSLYPLPEAAAMYPRILMKLTDVRSYGEMTARQVARVSATDVEPLMKEIFNLK